MASKRFWTGMDRRADLKLTDKILIGNIDNGEPEYIEVGDLPTNTGTPGDDGLSAYQIAVSEGFTGTEAEWLESLKGEDGSPGADGTTDISPKWVEVTADRNLLPTDIGKILYTRGATDVVITIPDDVALGATEDVAFTALHEGTGLLKFKQGGGVSSQPKKTKTALRPLSYLRRGANNWVCAGEADSWVPNIYNTANAASLINETNAITGTTGDSEWTPTSVASAPSPHDGSYSILYTHSGAVNTGHMGQIEITGLEVGAQYKVGAWIQQVSADSFGLGNVFLHSGSGGWTAITMLLENTNGGNVGEWAYYEAVGTTTASTALIRVDAASNADPGFKIAIDGITVEKI